MFITAILIFPGEAPEAGIEAVILNGTAESALRRYALGLVKSGEWPSHLSAKTPTETMPIDDLKEALSNYLLWAKGAGGVADLLGECSRDEMPMFIVNTILAIKTIVIAAPTVKTDDTPCEESVVVESITLKD